MAKATTGKGAATKKEAGKMTGGGENIEGKSAKAVDSRLRRVAVYTNGKKKSVVLTFTVWSKHEVMATVESAGQGEWYEPEIEASQYEKVYDIFPARVVKVAQRSALAIVRKLQAVELV